MALIDDARGRKGADRPLRDRRSFDPAPIAALAAFICGAPLLAVAVVALRPDSAEYMLHLLGTRLPGYVLTTALVGFYAAAGAALIGSLTAWLVARCDFPGRRLFDWMLILPLAVPAYVAAYAWLDLTQQAGPIASWLRDISPALAGAVPPVRGALGTGLVFALVLYPYVYLLAREAFSGQSADAYDAARTLGAGPVSAFRRAALPLARPAIAAGLSLVVMEALADYGAAAHLGAPTLSVGLVRAWAGAGSLVDAARLALLLVAISLVIFSIERAQRRRARIVSASGKRRPPPRMTLSGWRAYAALAACAAPILFGLVLPLARLGWRANHTGSPSGLLPAAQHSFTLAVGTALIAVCLGLGAAYAIRSGKFFGLAAARLAGLGYAAPGAVAAVGVIALLTTAQHLIDPAWRSLFGAAFPFLLTGGAGALILAYLSRFAAAAIGPSESALARVTPALDGAARTLGATPLQTAIRIHWPLISGGAAAAGLLVFVETLKELPATMILRPFNYDTLAVIAHNYASDERLGEAAAPSLLIVAAALPAMILVARRLSRESRADRTPGDER